MILRLTTYVRNFEEEETMDGLEAVSLTNNDELETAHVCSAYKDIDKT